MAGWTRFLGADQIVVGGRGRRATQPVAETRGPLQETLRRDPEHLQAVLEEARSAGAEGRVAASERSTYPASDAASLYAMKGRWDVANRARKISLYQAFLGESWVSACVEAIAARLISGGWMLKPADPKHPNVASKGPLEELLNWTNQDEDFAQMLHAAATDLLWSGETYIEMTWKRSPTLGRAVPFELYMVDVISMDYKLGENKKTISGYVQTTDTGEEVLLNPNQIIRIWLPDPRNRLKALAPIEKLLNPITWDTYLQLSEQKYFEQGNRGDININVKSGGVAMAGRVDKWIRERFLGVKNAHLPLVTFGDTEARQLGNRAAMDVLGRRKFARDEILSVYKVPPHLVSIIESGSIGGAGTSDTMEKQFIHTAVDPIRWRMLNPLNFRIALQGFGIEDWLIDTSYADLRDTKEITDIQVNRIKMGISNVNEERAEIKRDPVPGGDQNALILTREVVPVRDLQDMVSTQRLQTAAALQGAASPEQAAQQGTLPPPKPTTVPADEEKSPAERARRTLAALREAGGPPYRYGYTQVTLTGALADAITALSNSIAEDDLAEKGRETIPHVTIKYGLTDTGPRTLAELRAICASEPAITVRCGPTAVFNAAETGEDYDVVIVPIESAGLRRLNSLIALLLPCVDTHPTYKPHATLAYVRASRGSAYAGRDDVDGQEATIDHIMLSARDGTQTVLPLSATVS